PRSASPGRARRGAPCGWPRHTCLPARVRAAGFGRSVKGPSRCRGRAPPLPMTSRSSVGSPLTGLFALRQLSTIHLATATFLRRRRYNSELPDLMREKAFRPPPIAIIPVAGRALARTTTHRQCRFLLVLAQIRDKVARTLSDPCPNSPNEAAFLPTSTEARGWRGECNGCTDSFCRRWWGLP